MLSLIVGAFVRCDIIFVMDLHHLKIFLSVFKHKSFTSASKELCLSQPTVSDHIKTLEKDLDCRLFDRVGRSIIPTKEAEELLGRASELIEKSEALRSSIKTSGKEMSGEIVIGASTIPGTYLIPSVMASFRSAYPSITFKIIVSDSGDILDRVLEHEVLIGTIGARLGGAQIDYVPLIEDELVVVSSPSLVSGIRKRPSLKDIHGYPMVLREEGSGTRKEAGKILEAAGLSLADYSIAGIFGSNDAVKQAVKAGLGISILSKLSVMDELKYGMLKEIKLSGPVMKRNFYIITHKRRTLPREYDLFMKHLIKSFGKTSSR